MRIPFAFDPAYRLVDQLFGVTPASSWVDVSDEAIEARFGPWRVRTDRENVAEVTVTGPYSVPKTIGPAHVSLKDRGLTFASNTRRGACISFHQPVQGIDPVGLVRHPALTVTVDDPDALVEALRSDDVEQELLDDLHSMTARELRDLADKRGLAHTSSMKKADLIALFEEPGEG
jgi:hypothetical protein